MSVCDSLISQGEALTATVLAYEAERARMIPSLRTARLREAMIREARLMDGVLDSAKASLAQARAALPGLPGHVPPIPANDFEPEPHRA